MDRYLDFELATARDAWSRTWNYLKPKWENWPRELAIFLAGSSLTWWLQGGGQVVSTISKSFIGGALAIVLVFVLLLSWNFVAAPYRLWRAEKVASAAFTAAQTQKQSQAEIGRELEAHVRRAEKLLDSKTGAVLQNTFLNWFDNALASVAKCGDQERSLFESFRSLSRNPDYFYAGERQRLVDALAKLRLIMARAYARSENTSGADDEITQ
jgi:uncharacterized membrane protein YccC